MSNNNDCIFCKIIAGELPCHKIAETGKSIAILDAFPAALGHCLVIPKTCVENFFELSQEEVDDASRLLQKVGEAAMKAAGAPAMNLLSNIGRPAGQVVMHAHLHAIPRFEGDTITVSFGGGKPDITDDDKNKILNDIKKNL